MASSAEHRAAAEARLDRVPQWQVTEHSTVTDVLALVVGMLAEQIVATQALTHAVLALGKTPDGTFDIVTRDDEG